MKIDLGLGKSELFSELFYKEIVAPMYEDFFQFLDGVDDDGKKLPVSFLDLGVDTRKMFLISVFIKLANILEKELNGN